MRIIPDRFAGILADANARLGTDADRYSFIVVDLHHLLLAGFYRRAGPLGFCTVRANDPPSAMSATDESPYWPEHWTGADDGRLPVSERHPKAIVEQ